MQLCKLDNCLSSPAIKIIYFVAAISPFLILFSGPALAPAFILAALLPTILVIRRTFCCRLLKSNIYKTVLLFFAYSFVSIGWAIDPAESLNLWYRMVLFFIGFVALFEFIQEMTPYEKQRLARMLTIGFMVAAGAANIEIFSDGLITKFFRSFQAKEHIYKLTDLNRGASYLSIVFWPVVAYLLVQKRWLYALIVLLITAFTLFRLESQSSSLALVLSLLAFIIVCLWARRGVALMMVAAVLAVAGIATTAKLMEPAKMFEMLPNIPNSASEIRLYIWDFAADKAAQKPVFGWGFNASRSLPVSESDYVLNGRHPLPLHPHNSVLQVWLELGMVGLVIFTLFLLTIMDKIRRIAPPEQSHCRAHFNDISYLERAADKINDNMPMALAFGLFASYLAIGATGYGIWQNWWLAGGLLSACFMGATKK